MSKQRLIPIDRQTLKRVAYIVGQSSAAQQALDAAADYDGETLFWRAGEYILVERLPLPTASMENGKQ